MLMLMQLRKLSFGCARLVLLIVGVWVCVAQVRCSSSYSSVSAGEFERLFDSAEGIGYAVLHLDWELYVERHTAADADTPVPPFGEFLSSSQLPVVVKNAPLVLHISSSIGSISNSTSWSPRALVERLPSSQMVQVKRSRHSLFRWGSSMTRRERAIDFFSALAEQEEGKSERKEESPLEEYLYLSGSAFMQLGKALAKEIDFRPLLDTREVCTCA